MNSYVYHILTIIFKLLLTEHIYKVCLHKGTENGTESTTVFFATEQNLYG